MCIYYILNLIYYNDLSDRLGNIKFAIIVEYYIFEDYTVSNSINIKSGGNSAVKITFKNNFKSEIHLVIQIIYSSSVNWGYITTMATQLTTKSCYINMHNLDSNDITVKVGYFAFK